MIFLYRVTHESHSDFIRLSPPATSAVISAYEHCLIYFGVSKGFVLPFVPELPSSSDIFPPPSTPFTNFTREPILCESFSSSDRVAPGLC
jgi:hypothetical protein